MSAQNTITDKNEFQKTASYFFNNLFEEVLKKSSCEIEILGFENGPRHMSYHGNVPDAVSTSYDLCQRGLDVYMGVNTRVGQRGKKDNVKWLSTFHLDIDYGSVGHKKESQYSNYQEALEAIVNFDLPPTMVIHSGGGLHCYWVPKRPILAAEIGVERIEAVNKGLISLLGGDPGTYGIERILRVPGTFNFKNAGNPREVTIVIGDGPKYDIEQFAHLLDAHLKASSPENQNGTKRFHPCLYPPESRI